MMSHRRASNRTRTQRPLLEHLETRRLLDASGLFEPPINETIGFSPRAIALADLDSDGDDDMVIGHGSGLLVRLNDGAGNYTAGDAHALDPGLISVAIADLTGDGVLDIAGSTTNEGGARIFAGTGDGTFTLHDTVDLSGIPTEVDAVDIDGDDDLDLLVPILTGSSVKILINDGAGDFTEAASAAPGASFPISVAAADFVGDGTLRIATAGLGDSQVVMAYEFADVPGVWLQEAAYAVGAQPQIMEIADLDGDGDIDVVTGDQFGAGLALLMNNGDGTFADFVPLDTSDPIGALALSDLNNDGHLDIVAGSLGETTLFVLLGEGGGSFAAATTFSVGFSVEALSVADADNDGFSDIVAVGGGKVAYLYNTTEAPAAPAGVELADDSDRGDSSDDNLTNLNNGAGSELSFVVSGADVGATVRVYAGETLIAQAVADAADFTLSGNGVALADGYHSITATQSAPGSDVESDASPGVTIQIDTVAPVFSSAAAANATADDPFTFNVESDAEAAGGTYALVSGPAGLTLTSATGALAWNASMLQLGQHPVVVSITDAAGNSSEQTITITVSAGAARPDVIASLDLSDVYATLVPGDKKAKAVVNVGNQGNGDAQGSVTITVYASTDQALDGSDIVLGQISKGLKVKVGETKGYKVKLLVPGDAAAGTYHLLADVNTANVAGERRAGNDDAVASGTTDIAWRFGSFEGRNNVKLTVPGSGGSDVTFKMRGSGYGEITGGSAFSAITFTGVNNDNLKIQPAGGASLTLGDVTINGSLSHFKGKGVTIGGDLVASGPIGKAQWDAVTGSVSAAGISNLKLDGSSSGDWNITGFGLEKAKIGGSILAGTFNVSAGEVNNLKIDGLVAAAAELNFNAVSKLKLGGNSAGDWSFAAGLDKAKLGGSLTAGSFSVGSGEVNNLKIDGAVAAGTSLGFQAVSKLKIGGDLLSDLTTAYADKVNINGRWSGLFRATRTTGEGVGKFTVKGAASDAVLDAVGGIDKATLGDITNVTIYAGVDTSALASPGDLPTAFVNGAEIGKLNIKGSTNGATIAAHHLDNVKLGSVSSANELRLAATTVGKVQVTLEGSRYKFTGSELFDESPALPYLVVQQV